jgi:hypothetical protein
VVVVIQCSSTKLNANDGGFNSGKQTIDSQFIQIKIMVFGGTRELTVQ